MTENFNIEKAGYSRFSFQRDQQVLTASFDTEHPVNGVDGKMHAELASLFTDLQRDSASDIIILTGKGKAFCAGGDYEWFQAQIDDPANFRAIAWDAKRIVSTLLEMEKPILCRLNGAAAGLGATVALLCDVIVANDSAKIGDPHVKVGLVAGDGGAMIWPQLIGFARAKELLMTGDMLSAEQAVSLGLINHAVPEDQLDSKISEIVGKLQANPKWAVRWTKTVANIPLRALAAQMMDASIGYETVANSLKDRAEAVAAFQERRKPDLTGE